MLTRKELFASDADCYSKSASIASDETKMFCYQHFSVITTTTEMTMRNLHRQQLLLPSCCCLDAIGESESTIRADGHCCHLGFSSPEPGAG